eukprot:3618099-Karenia_brevis.AAC.1
MPFWWDLGQHDLQNVRSWRLLEVSWRSLKAQDKLKARFEWILGGFRWVRRISAGIYVCHSSVRTIFHGYMRVPYVHSGGGSSGG